MQYLNRHMVNKRKEFMAETIDMVKTKYTSHYDDFDESSLRDLCDALIAAKNEALSEGKESAPYLNDDNLTMATWTCSLVVSTPVTTHSNG